MAKNLALWCSLNLQANDYLGQRRLKKNYVLGQKMITQKFIQENFRKDLDNQKINFVRTLENWNIRLRDKLGIL